MGGVVLPDFLWVRRQDTQVPIVAQYLTCDENLSNSRALPGPWLHTWGPRMVGPMVPKPLLPSLVDNPVPTRRRGEPGPGLPSVCRRESTIALALCFSFRTCLWGVSKDSAGRVRAGIRKGQNEAGVLGTPGLPCLHSPTDGATVKPSHRPLFVRLT